MIVYLINIELLNPIGKLTCHTGSQFLFLIPSDTFKSELKTITYSVYLSDKSPLPTWLVYDSFRNILTGTCPIKEEILNLTISAFDGYNPNVYHNFSIEIYNNPPEIINLISNKKLIMGDQL